MSTTKPLPQVPASRLGRFLARLLGRNHQPVPPPAAAPQIPYSAAGSEPIDVPADLVGRRTERAALAAFLEERSVVFLHGPARIGKTYLAQTSAAAWKKEGRPFLYTCPADQGIGTLFSRLGRFFQANGHERFAGLAGKPEANDDDRTLLLADQLTQDRYLVVLDAFEQVAHRAPFRRLVQACCQEKAAGRLLVCSRDLPAWYEDLPAAYCGTVALGGLRPEDIRAIARQFGFAEADLEGLEQTLHPFMLQLLLFLARQRQTSPGALLAQRRGADLEDTLLREIYQGLEERQVLERLSVLRLPFQGGALAVFGGVEDRAREKPLSLLVDTALEGRCALHPLVRGFGLACLQAHEPARRQAHEQALQYYQPRLSSQGKGQVQACKESAYHLLELGRPREALDLLTHHHRAIISFGYGWELLALVCRIETSGLLEGADEAVEVLALHDLASIYVHLPVFSVADNHLKAIRYSGRAVDYYGPSQQQLLHASALNVQGMACSGLPVGDPRKNLQRAFDSFRQALAIFQQLDLAAGCALVHNNMGAAWMDLSALGGEWCIGRAVGHLKQAVRLYQNGIDPYTRALVERNLGHAQSQLGHVEEGMRHFQEALQHFRRDNLPREYADTQQILGHAHRLISSGKRPNRLVQAMQYYAEALTVYEEEIFPEDFARTQHYLGVAHRQLALYEDARSHQCLAVKCYRNALRVYTEEAFPYNHQVVLNNLERDLVELDGEFDWKYAETGPHHRR